MGIIITIFAFFISGFGFGFKFSKSWSSVNDVPLNLKWWYYKLMCELMWFIRNKIKSDKPYYYYLNKMILKTGINLYGDKI